MSNPDKSDDHPDTEGVPRAAAWTIGALLTALAVVLFGPLFADAEPVDVVTTTTSPVESELIDRIGDLRTASRSLYRRYGVYGPNRFPVADGACSPTGRYLAEHSLDPSPSTCRPETGRWVGFYTGEATTGPVVDYVVSWEHAWVSGAGDWEVSERTRFASDPANMVIVTAEARTARDGQDPGDWLPDRNVCGFVERWVRVKNDWGLTAAPFEKQDLVGAVKAGGGCHPEPP